MSKILEIGDPVHIYSTKKQRSNLKQRQLWNIPKIPSFSQLQDMEISAGSDHVSREQWVIDGPNTHEKVIILSDHPYATRERRSYGNIRGVENYCDPVATQDERMEANPGIVPKEEDPEPSPKITNGLIYQGTFNEEFDMLDNESKAKANGNLQDVKPEAPQHPLENTAFQNTPPSIGGQNNENTSGYIVKRDEMATLMNDIDTDGIFDYLKLQLDTQTPTEQQDNKEPHLLTSSGEKNKYIGVVSLHEACPFPTFEKIVKDIIEQDCKKIIETKKMVDELVKVEVKKEIEEVVKQEVKKEIEEVVKQEVKKEIEEVVKKEIKKEIKEEIEKEIQAEIDDEIVEVD
uniref:Uncharacterized protein n=1 Tax=Drosophila melanogaster TaxID=7227 RepID=M9PHX0_DROME|nr:uncharacterized protein Dmel_CG43843 [Drosophila melanogaster]AGB95525.1 uncharacterized protein Dmel_CG43843 [Drosophila melanogaster]|eukprot:NP_001259683.1 uncharacterized protein Dmel_CG43843 [Drosophila melanogaster]